MAKGNFCLLVLAFSSLCFAQIIEIPLTPEDSPALRQETLSSKDASGIDYRLYKLKVDSLQASVTALNKRLTMIGNGPSRLGLMRNTFHSLGSYHCLMGVLTIIPGVIYVLQGFSIMQVDGGYGFLAIALGGITIGLGSWQVSFGSDLCKM